ncbi:MAG: right-handed parallel beta-helix repeat-containing protein [Methanocella sp.]
MLVCSVALLAVVCQFSLGSSEANSNITSDAVTELTDLVPSDARPVASQGDINALPDGSNAVLTSDLSSITLSRPLALFGDGHSIGSVTLAADGVRISGLKAEVVVVRGDDCTIDHCTVDSDAMSAIRADGVNRLHVIDNQIYGYRVKDSYGLYATNCNGLIVQGNNASGAFYCFWIDHCDGPQVINNYVSHAPGYQQGLDFYMEYVSNGVFRGNEVEFNPYNGPGHTEDHDAIGFRYLDGVTIEDNIAGGHYYTLKIYNSKNCIIQNNTLYRAGSMRTGFYDSNLIVRNNKISGEPKVGLSIGIWINDGTKDSIYEGNEIRDCEYGFELSHYPPGHRYLNGGPSLPCSNITLKNNYIHDCSGTNIVAGDKDDKGSYVEINDYYTPTPTPVPSSTPIATEAPVATPGVQATATPAASSGNPIVDFITSIIRLIFH